MTLAVGIALITISVAATVTGVAAVLIAYSAIRAVEDVRDKIETKNGLTVGEMVQHNYSMAAQEVPPADRSPEQKAAVAMLTEQEHVTHAERQARIDRSFEPSTSGASS